MLAADQEAEARSRRRIGSNGEIDAEARAETPARPDPTESQMSHRDRHPLAIGLGSSFVMLLFASVVLIPDAIANSAEVRSPDGNVVVTVDLVSVGGLEGCPAYSVTYRGRPVLVESRLGLDLVDAPGLDHGFTIAATSRAGHDETWKPVYGEWGAIRDHYNELVVEWRTAHRPPAPSRAEGPRLRRGGGLLLSHPGTARDRAGRHRRRADAVPVRGSPHRLGHLLRPGHLPPRPARRRQARLRAAVDGRGGDRPLRGNRRGPARRLRPHAAGPAEGEPQTLRAMLGGAVDAAAPFATPWRVILLGDTPGRLIEHNDLILNLNDPRPGRTPPGSSRAR